MRTERQEAAHLRRLPATLAIDVDGEFYVGSKAIRADLPVKFILNHDFRWWEKKNRSVDWARAQSVATHELHHMAAVSSSTIGVLLTFLEIAKLCVVRELCRLVSSNRGRRLPSPPWAMTLSQHDEWSKKKDVLQQVESFRHLETATHLIEGTIMTSSVKAGAVLSRSMSAMHDALPSVSLPFVGLRDIDGSEDLPSCPVAVTGPQEGYRNYRFGSKAVYEGWADTVNMLLLGEMFGSETFREITGKMHKGMYRILFGMLMQNLPEPYTRDFTYLAIHALAVAELATNPCIIDSEPRRRWHWAEFHPGWRASLVLGAIRGEGILPMHLEDGSSEFARFQRQICAALGWRFQYESETPIDRGRDEASDSGGRFELETANLTLDLFQSGRAHFEQFPGAMAVYPMNRIGRSIWPMKKYEALLVIGSDGVLRREGTPTLLAFHVSLLYALALMRMPSPFSTSQFLAWVFPRLPGAGKENGVPRMLTEYFSGVSW